MATKEELKSRLVTGHVLTEKDLHDILDVAGEQGPKGDPGTNGAKGAKGDPGAKGAKGDPGADGFGTEEQYNELVSRIEALESPAE